VNSKERRKLVGKANDKKVVKENAKALVTAIGNLLESDRERKFRYAAKPKPLPRRLFCQRNRLNESTVAYIETGRMLRLSMGQLRVYFAVVRGRDDKRFVASFKKVYDGLRELGKVMKVM
jgi:hypothetical protein